MENGNNDKEFIKFITTDIRVAVYLKVRGHNIEWTKALTIYSSEYHFKDYPTEEESIEMLEGTATAGINATINAYRHIIQDSQRIQKRVYGGG